VNGAAILKCFSLELVHFFRIIILLNLGVSTRGFVDNLVTVHGHMRLRRLCESESLWWCQVTGIFLDGCDFCRQPKYSYTKIDPLLYYVLDVDVPKHLNYFSTVLFTNAEWCLCIHLNCPRFKVESTGSFLLLFISTSDIRITTHEFCFSSSKCQMPWM
jgi:hypothetical protein